MSHISQHQTDEMILIYSLIIEEITRITDNLGKLSFTLEHSKSIYDSSLKDKLSIYNFLKRIHFYTQFEPDILIASLIYIDRFCQEHGNFYMNSLNCYHLVFASIILSIKLYDDYIISNQMLAKIIEIDCKELMNITYDFFEKINFSSWISEDDLYKYNDKIDNYMLSNKCRDKLHELNSTKALSFYKTCKLPSANLYI